MIGRCHCGAVVLDIVLAGGLTTAHRCDCSFCRRRGAIAVSAPLNGIKTLQGAENLTLYQFNTNTANIGSAKPAASTPTTNAVPTQTNTVSTSPLSMA